MSWLMPDKFVNFLPDSGVLQCGTIYDVASFCFNTLSSRQNGCHFADDIFKCIFLYENV